MEQIEGLDVITPPASGVIFLPPVYHSLPDIPDELRKKKSYSQDHPDVPQMERKAQSFSHACRIRELWQFEKVGQPLPYLPNISLFKVTLHLPWTFDMPIPVAGIRIREPEGQRSKREGEELGARRD